MPERAISYSAWNAPGTAIFSAVVQYAGNEEGVQVIGLPSIRVNYSVKQVETRNLSSGFNSVPIPSQAIGVAIVFPDGNAVTVTLKGVTGDTGIPLNPNGLAILTLPTVSPPTTIGLTAGGAINGVRFLWF
jgi:hypothetical protein